MKRNRYLLAFVVLCPSIVGASARAGDEQVSTLKVLPSAVRLVGLRDRQQLIVSGLVTVTDHEEITDLTREATFESPASAVAVVTSSGLVIPRGDGEIEIVVRAQGQEVRVPVNVTGTAGTGEVAFEADVVPALAWAGCSQGACHGSPQGKNGFRLSLQGFDPSLDYETLTREGFGRRTNPHDPQASLILKKGLAELPHQGGTRFRQTDPAYQTIRAWIQQGCRREGTARKLLRVEVHPASGRLAEASPRQQLIAMAHFDDGTARDVTHLAVFTSNDEKSATVTREGLVEFERTAEATFLVRYLGQVVGSRLTWIRRDPEFVFQAPQRAGVIDDFVFGRQRDLQIQPAALADDAVFLRRVYLDVIGTLPTSGEARQFLDSTDPNKRAKLIDELLERKEFAPFWALKWADLLRGSDVTISRRGVFSYHRYLVRQFRDDRPFTEFVRETLTGLGSTLDNPPAAFFRTARTPEDMAEAASQLFLGVRIGCAKCHNHPFESITQDDYYGLAAWFARVKTKGAQFGLDDEIIWLDRRSEVRHPRTNANVVPSAFGWTPEVNDPEADRREQFVAWLLDEKNPYFARSVVNRLWFHLFGRGIVEPVDDFRATNPPSNPQLLDHLAARFAAEGWRIKPVLREMLNSRTYQLDSRPAAAQSRWAADPERYFSRAGVRMLTGEQILDAVAKAAGVPVRFDGYPPGTRAIELAEGAVDHPFLLAFAKPVRDSTCECARDGDPSISQVIHLLNNPEIIGGLRSENSRLMQLVNAGRSDAEIIDELYLATLSRRPTNEERRVIELHLKSVADRAEALRDVQHALLNSNEFLLRH